MEKINEMLENTKTIAVIGMKSDEFEEAYKIPLYMKEQGYKIFAVNPTRSGKEIWDTVFYEKLSDIKENIDMVNIFRRPEYLVEHAKEILRLNPLPKYVWFQLGIYNDEAAKLLDDAGIKVVQNRCIMVEHVRLYH
jgi:predicted CoA-binding protein